MRTLVAYMALAMTVFGCVAAKDDGDALVVHAAVMSSSTIQDELELSARMLAKETRRWVDRNCPGHEVDIDALVRECIEAGFPVELCVAQAYLECQFGVAYGSEARNKRSYSMFGIGHWGDGVCRSVYEDWNASVAPYISYVKRCYIGVGSAPEGLGQSYNDLINREYRRWDYRRFRTAERPNGGRYANGGLYESRIRRVLRRLGNETDIHYYAVKAQPGVEELVPRK